ncbi:MAG: redoxin domain-containing protein [Campylobacterota bacterium]|nr:redoxin domain-containing protein [Campylobacterota bacterium]
MYYTEADISGKKRFKGGEAPSAKVYSYDDQEMIIGMIAVNVQLLVSLYSLDEQNCKDIINKFEMNFKDESKLNINVVVKNSFEDIKNFNLENKIVKIEILQDTKSSFSQKFGVLLKDDKYVNNMANGLFLIDKEGEIKYAEYFDSLDESQLDKLISIVKDVINFKPKGHVHENWMG